RRPGHAPDLDRVADDVVRARLLDIDGHLVLLSSRATRRSTPITRVWQRVPLRGTPLSGVRTSSRQYGTRSSLAFHASKGTLESGTSTRSMSSGHSPSAKANSS